MSEAGQSERPPTTLNCWVRAPGSWPLAPRAPACLRAAGDLPVGQIRRSFFCAALGLPALKLRKPRAPKLQFAEPIQSDLGCPVLLAKIFRFCSPSIDGFFRAVPARKRGVSRSSRTLGTECGGRFGDARRAAREADGEVVWSWRPDAGVKFSRGNLRGRRWQESPVAGESTKETVKTIARGMPGDFRCDLTYACAFYRYHGTRGNRAHRAPGIPCALCFPRAERAGQASRETRGEIANL